MKYTVTHKENPEEYRRQQCKNYRASDPIRYLYNQAKYRAKKQGKEFSIERDDLVIPELCPILGIPMFFSEGYRTGNSLSIDRVDNSVSCLVLVQVTYT